MDTIKDRHKKSNMQPALPDFDSHYCFDRGILGFYWDAPTEIGEIISDNVELKPFDEIMAVFNQQIINQCVFSDEIAVTERQITIDEITLGMMKIRQQNSDKYMYVPG